MRDYPGMTSLICRDLYFFVAGIDTTLHKKFTISTTPIAHHNLLSFH
jgi:hypothetical protein